MTRLGIQEQQSHQILKVSIFGNKRGAERGWKVPSSFPFPGPLRFPFQACIRSMRLPTVIFICRKSCQTRVDFFHSRRLSFGLPWELSTSVERSVSLVDLVRRRPRRGRSPSVSCLKRSYKYSKIFNLGSIQTSSLAESSFLSTFKLFTEYFWGFIATYVPESRLNQIYTLLNSNYQKI